MDQTMLAEKFTLWTGLAGWNETKASGLIPVVYGLDKARSLADVLGYL